jgi:adenylyltransferase/sulfurtransferase
VKTFVIVGAGGLGCPLAMALGAAGDSRLVLLDPDVVDETNLQRQVLFRTADVGRPKVEAARDALIRRGVEASRIYALSTRFTAASAEHVGEADVICDGSDDLGTKFLVNDVALEVGVPVVVAAALRDRGQVFPVRPGVDACYRCLFEAPPEDAGLTCEAAGVLGATCGMVAGIAAQAALALAGRRDVAARLGRFWLVEGLEVRSFSVQRRRGCAACAARRAA